MEPVEGKPRRRARGRVDYTLRVNVNATAQPLAVALLDNLRHFALPVYE